MTTAKMWPRKWRYKIMNDFIKAITNKKTKSYRAHMELQNGEVGITAYYSKDILDLVIEEGRDLGHKLIKIEESEE